MLTLVPSILDRRRVVVRRPWWLLAAIVGGWLLVGHGCHGPDEDHELCVPLTENVQYEQAVSP